VMEEIKERSRKPGRSARRRHVVLSARGKLDKPGETDGRLRLCRPMRRCSAQTIIKVSRSNGWAARGEGLEKAKIDISNSVGARQACHAGTFNGRRIVVF